MIMLSNRIKSISKKSAALLIAALLAVAAAGCSAGNSGTSGTPTDTVPDTTPAGDSDISCTPTDTVSDITSAGTSDTSGTPTDTVSDITPAADSGIPDSVGSYEARVSYCRGVSTLSCTVTWEHEGHSYEMCIAGLPDELSGQQITDIIDTFHAGGIYTLSDPGLIDAEKVTNKLYGTLGNWVYTGGDREDPFWGDSSMCWAAATSNMLVISGWTACPTRDGSIPFADEDELFNYYKQCFDNDGGYHYDGVCWYFDGETFGETYPRTEGTDYLDQKGPDYCTAYTFNPDHDNLLAPARLPELLEVLKRGGAAGICLDFCEIDYTLKDDPSVTVSYSVDRGAYCSLSFLNIDASDENAIDCYYTYNSDGSIKVLDAGPEGYTDAEGNIIPEDAVLSGIVYYAEGIGYFPAEQVWDSLECIVYEPHDLSEIDTSNPYCFYAVGNGAHAVTVSGYVLDLDAGTPEERLASLFITDSDNDGAIYVLTDENRDSAARPNSCTMFPVSTVRDFDDNILYNVEGYMEGTNSLIASFTALEPYTPAE